MARPGHQPHWPDKAMFASIMLLVAGTMGTLFGLVAMLPNFTLGTDKIPSWLRDYPSGLQALLSLATLAFGFVSLRAKRKRFSYAGCATGIASLSFLGLVPILSIMAIGFLALAHREGEDLTGTRHGLTSRDWPDKAIAASLFLLVAGVLSVLWGVLILFGASKPVLLADLAGLEGTFDVLAGAWCAFAAWQVYHLRRPWTGFVGIGAAGLAFGLYVMGPLLALTALVLLLLAKREDEFTPSRASG